MPRGRRRGSPRADPRTRGTPSHARPRVSRGPPWNGARNSGRSRSGGRRREPQLRGVSSPAVTFQRDPRRPVVQRRRRGALLPTVVVLVVLLILGLILSQLWTDALWYSQLGYLQVFRKELVTRVLLFVLGAAVMAAG